MFAMWICVRRPKTKRTARRQQQKRWERTTLSGAETDTNKTTKIVWYAASFVCLLVCVGELNFSVASLRISASHKRRHCRLSPLFALSRRLSLVFSPLLNSLCVGFCRCCCCFYYPMLNHIQKIVVWMGWKPFRYAEKKRNQKCVLLLLRCVMWLVSVWTVVSSGTHQAKQKPSNHWPVRKCCERERKPKKKDIKIYIKLKFICHKYTYLHHHGLCQCRQQPTTTSCIFIAIFGMFVGRPLLFSFVSFVLLNCVEIRYFRGSS